MTQNKQTVQNYMDAFARTDHPDILACLTHDVEWIVPGVYHTKGKAAFDNEIEGEAFGGNPIIQVSRMTEEQNVVIAEGSVRAPTKDGGFVNLVFCDVFEMQDGKIRKLISYLMPVKE